MAPRKHNTPRNEAKVRILEALSRLSYPIRPGDLWVKAVIGTAGIDAVYMALMRYQKWGLVARKLQGKRVYYKITQRGRDRLAWLKARKDAADRRSKTSVQPQVLV